MEYNGGIIGALRLVFLTWYESSYVNKMKLEERMQLATHEKKFFWGSLKGLFGWVGTPTCMFVLTKECRTLWGAETTTCYIQSLLLA